MKVVVVLVLLPPPTWLVLILLRARYSLRRRPSFAIVELPLLGCTLSGRCRSRLLEGFFLLWSRLK